MMYRRIEGSSRASRASHPADHNAFSLDLERRGRAAVSVSGHEDVAISEQLDQVQPIGAGW
jgi:hypothetical protein